MNSEKLNRWLTLGANFGVLVGIVFLAFELQQNNELLQADASYNHYINRLSHMESLRTSVEFGDLLAKLEQGTELSRSEEIRIEAFYMTIFLRWQYEFSEIQAGRLNVNDHFFDVWRNVIHDNAALPSPGIVKKWEKQKSLMQPEFVAFMEDRIVN